MVQIAILLAVLGVSAAFPQGFTPEVLAERNRFIQLYQEAALAALLAPDDNEIAQQAKAAPAATRIATPAVTSPLQTTGYVGPLAATIPASLPGAFTQVPDAPEVAAAKKAFQQAFQAQVQLVAPVVTKGQPQKRSAAISTTTGVVPSQPAIVLLRLNDNSNLPLNPFRLPITDIPQTPEVNAAISHFSSAYSHAAAAMALAKKQAAMQKATGITKKAPVPIPGQWVGPLASTVPAGLPGSGNVIDTPEVSLAKAAFNQAYQAALIG